MAKRSKIQAEGRQIARIAREGVQACMEDMEPAPMRCHVTEWPEDAGGGSTCCVHGEDVMPGCWHATRAGRVEVVPQIAETRIERRSPEDGEMVSLPACWVYVEIGSERYDHDVVFSSYAEAERLADRIFRANLPAAHFLASSHWSKWTNPYAGDLEPFGPAWQDEQRECAAA